MGKSFYWMDKGKIEKFYDRLVLVATNSGALAKIPFNSVMGDVQSAIGARRWIVYDYKNYWYELEEGKGA